MTEKDTVIRLKDDTGNEYILYPATKAENIIGTFDKSKVVGIDKVDNTSDMDKPISTATQAALNALRSQISSGGSSGSGSGGVKIATCNTASNVAAKVAATPNGDFMLTDGALVFVIFEPNDTTEDYKTLNIDGTGAKSICANAGIDPAWSPLDYFQGFVYSAENDIYVTLVQNYSASDGIYNFTSNGYYGISEVTKDLSNLVPRIPLDDENIAVSDTEHRLSLGHYGKVGVAASYEGTAGDALIIGNGTYSSKSNAFRVAYSGSVYGSGAYNSTGADYGEQTEWEDGNPNGEDRRGLFAYMVGSKMRLANADDTDKKRLGIISAVPAVVGDSYDDYWHGKYLTDVFGVVQTQLVHHEAVYEDKKVKNPETGEITVVSVCVVPEHDSEEPILNPDYDSSQEYIPRSQRKEYNYWGFTGRFVTVDDGTCMAGGYCYPGINGVATACDDAEKGFFVMERIDDTHIRVQIK